VHDRYFTVSEAEAMIPQLEELFERIGGLRVEVDRRMEQVQILDALWGAKVLEPDNPDQREFSQHQERVRAAVAEIEELVQTGIIDRGVRFPQGGLEHGLVDFPTRLDGRTVYLCWQYGEEGILAWHEVEEGFAGRQPLTRDDARRMGAGKDGQGR
jgi:hypothetical protein